MMRVFRLYLVLIVVALHVASLSAVVGATQQSTPEAPNRMVSIYPAESGPGTFVTVTLNAGETADFTIVVGNAGNVAQSIRAYPIPALTADNGGFAAAPYGTSPDAPTSWLDIPELKLELDPGMGQEVMVQVSVPADNPPGEYVTAIAAEQAEAFEIEGTSVINQRVRTPMPVLIIVEGELHPSFELTDARIEIREDVLVGIVEIENTGNAIVRPRGTAKLADANGDVLGVAEISLESIYAGTSTSFYFAWPNVHGLDSYEVQIELADSSSSASDERVFANVVPSADREVSVAATPVPALAFSRAHLEPLTDDVPPSMLAFTGEISNPGEAIEDARVSIVTYQDGEEVDRYPIMQGVTIEPGTTPLEARYSLPGGFTEGTYTFEVTIDVGGVNTQTVLATQQVEFEVVVP